MNDPLPSPRRTKAGAGSVRPCASEQVAFGDAEVGAQVFFRRGRAPEVVRCVANQYMAEIVFRAPPDARCGPESCFPWFCLSFTYGWPYGPGEFPGQLGGIIWIGGSLRLRSCLG